MDLDRLQRLIEIGESLKVEFKSDRRRISDREIYEDIVALANTEGGVLLIGVEDDGTVTGARPRHNTTIDPLKLQSAIFNNTVPNINTRVSVLTHSQGAVLVIEVDPYPEPCATAAGRSLWRTIGPSGRPQTVPYYPRDQRSRRTDLGLLDFSAQVLDAVSFKELDPLEFERLRQAIVRLRGDQTLLNLSNEEVAKALQLVESKGRRLVPNVAGLLLLGRTDVLQEIIPTHEVYFQVLDALGNVKVNDSFRWPLLRSLEEVESRFTARNEEKEVTIGLFRFPVPDYASDGFREAVNNAVLHRDYSRLGGVYIQWYPDHLLIANPGGFPAGITINNILVHEPKPRNPRLAGAFKRIGLIEQTGRGVDRIFMGQLRYGRPAPDYSRSDPNDVRVVLRGGNASLRFAAFVYEQDKAGRPLTLDELMVLNHLFFERRIDSESVGVLIQKGTSEGHVVLERLVERGLIDAKGERRGRVYHLAAALYAKIGDPSGYVRIRGFEPIQQEQMILQYVDAHGKITRSEASGLCLINENQAYRRLQKMCKQGLLVMGGKPPKGAYYVRDK
ncbi:MAG: RNA-binding domain-containing protein [Bacillota bacterium]